MDAFAALALSKEGRKAAMIEIFTLVYQADAIGILYLDARQYFRFFKCTMADLHPNGAGAEALSGRYH